MNTLVLPPAIRVIIYGVHVFEWMICLDHDALIWQSIPSIKEVLVILDIPGIEIPPPRDPLPKTVIIPLLEEHTKNCPTGFFSLISNAQTIDILSKKEIFLAYMAKIGLLHLCPKYYVEPEEIIYPCMLKRTDLNSGAGIVLVQSWDQLSTYLNHNTWYQETVVLQEFIVNETEYVTHCVCKNGRILWHTSLAYTLESNSHVRTAVSIDTITPYTPSKETLAQLEQCLIPLQYCGPCNVDYTFTADGEIKIFEIYPRLGGSLMRPENSLLLREAIQCIIGAAFLA